MEQSLKRAVRAATVIGGALAAKLSIAGPATAHPLGVRSSLPGVGPCALTKLPGEAIQDFSSQLIRCAATRWPVPGGADEAICIAQRESGLIPTASSPTGEYVGLFQHLAAAWPDRYAEWTRPGWQLRPSPLNGRTNAIVTMRMVNAEGWGPWLGAGC